ncbi:MAG: hypothetical protein WCP55_23540, partial [Lentisphaerota bacterium]
EQKKEMPEGRHLLEKGERKGLFNIINYAFLLKTVLRFNPNTFCSMRADIFFFIFGSKQGDIVF